MWVSHDSIVVQPEKTQKSATCQEQCEMDIKIHLAPNSKFDFTIIYINYCDKSM